MMGVKRRVGVRGERRSINIARSLTTSANNLHRLASISSCVPRDQANRMLAIIPDPSRIEKGLLCGQSVILEEKGLLCGQSVILEEKGSLCGQSVILEEKRSLFLCGRSVIP